MMADQSVFDRLGAAPSYQFAQKREHAISRLRNNIDSVENMDSSDDEDELRRASISTLKKQMRQSRSYQNLRSAKALLGTISDRREANLRSKKYLHLDIGDALAQQVNHTIE